MTQQPRPKLPSSQEGHSGAAATATAFPTRPSACRGAEITSSLRNS